MYSWLLEFGVLQYPGLSLFGSPECFGFLLADADVEEVFEFLERSENLRGVWLADVVFDEDFRVIVSHGCPNF